MLRMSALEHYRSSEHFAEIAFDAKDAFAFQASMERAKWHASMVLATSIVVVGTPEELNAIVKD